MITSNDKSIMVVDDEPDIHNISSVADFTISRYRSCALAELGITSMSAKSTPASISFILSVESIPTFHYTCHYALNPVAL